MKASKDKRGRKLGTFNQKLKPWRRFKRWMYQQAVLIWSAKSRNLKKKGAIKKENCLVIMNNVPKGLSQQISEDNYFWVMKGCNGLTITGERL